LPSSEVVREEVVTEELEEKVVGEELGRGGAWRSSCEREVEEGWARCDDPQVCGIYRSTSDK
jgi:hypothetical protein